MVTNLKIRDAAWIPAPPLSICDFRPCLTREEFGEFLATSQCCILETGVRLTVVSEAGPSLDTGWTERAETR